MNPELEHHAGDMRTVRLHRQFDIVFVHDAVCYMTSENDLRQAFETAYVHCRSGGVAVFAPDYVRETFEASTDHGGAEGEQRAIRWLAWTSDPDPSDTTYVVDYAYMFRDADGAITVEHDRHVEGLFSREVWQRLLTETGFRVRSVFLEHSDVPSGTHEIFICRRAGMPVDCDAKR